MCGKHRMAMPCPCRAADARSSVAQQNCLARAAAWLVPRPNTRPTRKRGSHRHQHFTMCVAATQSASRKERSYCLYSCEPLRNSFTLFIDTVHRVLVNHDPGHAVLWMHVLKAPHGNAVLRGDRTTSPHHPPRGTEHTAAKNESFSPLRPLCLCGDSAVLDTPYLLT